MTLSDTHLVLLSTAAQREDRLLIPSSKANGPAGRSLHKKLIRLGLAEEVSVRPGPEAWRVEADDHFGLKITAAALVALGIEPEPVLPPQAPTNQPRSGSKIDLVLDLLGREEGASADELCARTGWQAHTMRAALTGLRKRGQTIELSTFADGRRAYRIVPDAPGRHSAGDLCGEGR